MKINNLLSKDMPDIDDSIKECVNFGRWFLFKSGSMPSVDLEAAYYLKVDSKTYELNAKGKILKEIKCDDVDISIDELIYFSDLKKPGSLSSIRNICSY